jgi:hypothetical protein
MITDKLPCDRCKKVDITGEMNEERLCPVCYSALVGADYQIVRREMKQQMMWVAEQKVPEIRR